MTLDTILDEAKSLVHNDRGAAYGHPYDDFSRSGRMWAAILGIPEVTPEQVAMCMIAVKLSRECNKPGHDNRVDVAGYVETLDMVVEERASRSKPKTGGFVWNGWAEQPTSRSESGMSAIQGTLLPATTEVDDDPVVGVPA